MSVGMDVQCSLPWWLNHSQETFVALMLLRCSSCGEPYFIGECGQAMQMARCPSCGGNIGGQSHQLSNPNDARLTRRQAGMALKRGVACFKISLWDTLFGKLIS